MTNYQYYKLIYDNLCRIRDTYNSGSVELADKIAEIYGIMMYYKEIENSE